ncbi:homeobox KN domain containing protein [Nitzschia inconspicua]|uniref:Homeobox KN domain containing protein n=1 Tax=Nitzschia inconspicua TaxID=303405 RepID=A0A9K3PVQ3_9STRA|nr:homeobox KN domain containing protein [Nitzschia inconspicua]
MLQAATPRSYFNSTTAASSTGGKSADDGNMPDSDYNSDDDDFGGGKHRNKSRRELPAGAVATLKAWLLSPEHFTHPYPTPQDQVMLMQKTGIDKKQLKNWFTNARRRIWKPMLKKQLEQGKLAATGTGAVTMNGVGVIPGMMVMQGQIPGHTDQMQFQTQQSVQEVQFDQYGNPIYQHQQAPAPAPQYYDPNTGQATTLGSSLVPQNAPSSLPPSAAAVAPAPQPMSKTDSHAVLMELFARDQDLVRQATESAANKSGSDAQKFSIGQPMSVQPQFGGPTQSQSQTPQPVSSQHPMKTPSQGRLVNVPTLNSWPHFSSVSSLNNLGTMPGVKSITSLSAADLVKQGAVNSVGNLAQVKSVESMGKNDSYAFLEVFFGDRSSNALSSMIGSGSKDQRGIKRERDEDNDVGLSLEDESPSASGGHSMQQDSVGSNAVPGPSDMSSHLFGGKEGTLDSTDTLKRAYDDAMAARGLISVSRSSEKLTDLALPAKIQRTLSQELLRQPQPPQQPQQTLQSYIQYHYTPAPSKSVADLNSDGNQSLQYPAQPSAQSDQGHFSGQSNDAGAGTSVEVPSATKCAICHKTNVDTQLRPCGHMFHEQCLKPTFQACMGAPKCPVDHTPMQSALLAIPTDENAKPRLAGAPMVEQSSTWGCSQIQQGQSVSDTNH